MAPVEDLESRDLAWISDFVMQQMVIMLRPVMDHLQQSDYEVDHTQRMVQQLSSSLSEVQNDVERTNRCLAILRQGLGVQNERRCALRCDLEGVEQTVQRLDKQVEGMLRAMRGVEDGLAQQGKEVRGIAARQEELAKQAVAGTTTLEDLRASVEAISKDLQARVEGAPKDSLLDGDVRLEPWQRELRDLRCSGGPSGAAAEKVEPWPQKKTLAEMGGSGHGAGFIGAKGLVDPGSSGGSSHQSKRLGSGRAGSGSGRGGTGAVGLGQQEHLDFEVRPRSSSRPMVWAKVNGADGEDGGLAGLTADPPLADSRLPVLVARRPGVSLPPDRLPAEAPRLRFTATMAKPPSNGPGLQ